MEFSGLMESVRNYLLGCPLLRDGVLHVDYLGMRPTEYSVEAIPAKSVLKEYIDGSSLRQFVFAFGSVEDYGAEVDINLKNSMFYEGFARWMEARNRKKAFPPLRDGQEVVRMEVQGAGYALETSENTARYQIQCRMVYYQRGDYKL